MQDNSAYCAHVFKNIYIEKHANNQSRVSACCINTPDNAKSYVNFETDPYLTDQRQRIMQGEKISACNACWKQENNSTYSARKHDHTWYSKSQGPLVVELLGIDYNVTPICNAKCIMCSSYFSSAWAAEDEKFGKLGTPRTFGNTRHNTEIDLKLDRIEKLYFNGGEPFLSPDMNTMLQNTKQAQGNLKSVHVSLNTNGSIWPDNEFFALVKDAKSLVINVSIDAVDTAFEYVRYPLKWWQVEQNLKQLGSQNLISNRQGYTVSIATVVGIHNVFEIHKLKRWFEKIQQDLPWCKDLHVQPAHGMLRLQSASAALTQEIERYLGQDSIDQRIRCWLVKDPSKIDADWIWYLNQLDQRRKLNWRDHLPGLASAVASCKVDTNIFPLTQ